MQFLVDRIRGGHWEDEAGWENARNRRVSQFLGALMHRSDVGVPCLSAIADFLAAEEKLVVVARSTVHSLDATGPSLAPCTCITNSFEGDLSSVCSVRGTVLVCGSGGVNTVSLKAGAVGCVGESVQSVLCISSTPRGAYFATGSSNATVTVWSSDTQRPLHHLNGHTDWVRFVKFAKGRSPDLRLFSGGDDGAICQWDPLDGALLGRVDYARGQSIQLLEVSYYTGLIAIACGTPVIALYTCATSKPTRRRQHDEGLPLESLGLISSAHEGAAVSASFSADAQWIATTGEDEAIAVSTVAEPRRTFSCSAFVTKRRCFSFMNTFTAVRFLTAPPFSSVIIVAACANDGSVVQWVIDPRDGRNHYVKHLQLHLGPLLMLEVVR